jgi:Transposase
VTIVAHSRPFIVGVDTHAKTHTYAVIDATGQLLGEQFPTTAQGVARAIAWVGRRTTGQAEALWVIECVATYGARLADAAAEAGYEVAEAPRMSAKIRHGVGKSDAMDAQAIATAALALDEARLRRPRADQGVRQALRVLVASRDQMTQEKTMNVNALTALLRVHDLGIDARKPLTAAQIGEASRWRGRDESLAQAVARDEAIRLARRVLTLEEALTVNHDRMAELITDSPAAPLLEENGDRRIHRCSRHHRLVSPRQDPRRGRLRLPRRREPHPRFQRQHDPAPPQPRRRPAPEQSTSHHHGHEDDPRPQHQGLRGEAARRRTHTTRDPTLPQTLHRPISLSNPQRPTRHPRDDLTDIEASFAKSRETCTRVRIHTRRFELASRGR